MWDKRNDQENEEMRPYIPAEELFDDDIWDIARPKKKHTALKIVGIVLAVLLGLGLVGSLTYMGVNYWLNSVRDGMDFLPFPDEGYENWPNFEIEEETDEEKMPIYVVPDDEKEQLNINELTEDAEELSLNEIYKKCIQSVVGITSLDSDGSTSMGTGVVMSENGFIITNYHVIQGASTLITTFSDGTDYETMLIGYDESNDIAVVKIDAEGLTAAEFGNSDILEVGDVVAAIGNPGAASSLWGTMTDGIVSAIDRSMVVDGKGMTLIQTNAALNSGNSGGPLINIYGQVIGINVMKLTSDYVDIEGLGFAIPISQIKPVIDELIDTGEVSARPQIGISVSNVTAAMAAYYEIPRGLLVAEVDESSDAYQKGIRAGDVIVEANGQPVTETTDLGLIKNMLGIGDELVLKIFRENEYFDITVVLMADSDF